MGYSADKSPLIGHLAGPIRRLKPLGAQRQEKCGPNHLTREGLHATTPRNGGSIFFAFNLRLTMKVIAVLGTTQNKTKQKTTIAQPGQ